VVTTLVDFPCWQELVRRGVAPADAADVVFDQVRAALARAGVTVHHPHEGYRP
jgi:hypothetical protein